MTTRTNAPKAPKSRLMTVQEMALELSVSPKSISKGRYLFSVMIRYGMFSISDPESDKTTYRMRRSDFDLAVEAISLGMVRNTGAAGTRPEPGDSQCASQPVNQGSDGEPSGPELANHIPQP